MTAEPARAAPGRDDVARVLREPGRLRTWFQPIVDTATGGAAGWEALSRFAEADGGRSPWGPAEWFAAAQGSDLGAELEARALATALAALPRLPPDTFLTTNVSPGAIASAPVAAVLERHGDLSRVIVEVTETDFVDDVRTVASVCAGIRAAGGLVAVDDAGSGYAGLALIASLRPQLVKVDRELVSGCDSDPVKLSLMEVLGVWASGMDAWLLAEGVETMAEYTAVLSLGVPLVQGYLTGRPAPDPLDPDPATRSQLRLQRHRVALREAVASVMAPWPVHAVGDGLADDAQVAGGHGVLTEAGWPVRLVQAAPDGGASTTSPVSLRVRPSETVVETLRRAMAREPRFRYDPVVVTDPRGAPVGVATVEAMVARVLEPAG